MPNASVIKIEKKMLKKRAGYLTATGGGGPALTNYKVADAGGFVDADTEAGGMLYEIALPASSGSQLWNSGRLPASTLPAD